MDEVVVAEVDVATPRPESPDDRPLAILVAPNVGRPDVKPPKSKDAEEVGVYVKVVPPCTLIPPLVRRVVIGKV